MESLPNLNPAFLLSASRPFNWWPSVWLGSMLCGTACDSTDSREISNDGNPSYLPPLHFLPTIFTRWLPSWVPSSRLERHLPTSTPNIASFDHLAQYWSSNQRGSMKGPTKIHHPTPSNEIQRNSAGEHWLNRSPHSGSQQLPS